MSVTLQDDPPTPNGRSLRVLVADNDPEVQAVLRGWLEALGYEVVSAESGDEARRHLAHGDFAVIVTEVIMPNGDGLELIIDARKRCPAARRIAMSGGGQYLRSTDCLRVAAGLGAHVTLLKPMDRSTFEQALCGSTVAVPPLPVLE